MVARKIEAGALLDLVEEVRGLREDEGGVRGLLTAAFRQLAERSRPRRSLRPNTPPEELRRAYLDSTSVERLRETAELSYAVTTLAGYGAGRRGPVRKLRPERPATLRFFELLRVLRAHDVEFVLIGGFALGFHGVVRAAKGVDIVPERGERNLSRLWGALAELEAEPQGLEGFRTEVPVEWGLDGLIQGGGNWIVHTRFGRLDLMQWVAPFDSYEELRANAIEEHVDESGASLLVAGLEDLIAMKEAAGRDQDRLDITALRMAHGLEE